MSRSGKRRAYLKNAAFLAGTFSITFALLMTAWMVAGGPVTPRATATLPPTPAVTDIAQPDPSPTDSPIVILTPMLSEAPTDSLATSSPSPSPTAAPSTTITAPQLRTPIPFVPPQPPSAAGDTMSLVID